MDSSIGVDLGSTIEQLECEISALRAELEETVHAADKLRDENMILKHQNEALKNALKCFL